MTKSRTHIAAAAAALMTYLGLNSGLLYPTLSPWLLLGVVPGIAGALAGASTPWTCLSVGAAVAAGMIFEPPAPELAPAFIMVACMLAVGVSALVALVIRHDSVRPGIFGVLATVLILSQLWLTAAIVLGAAPPGGQVPLKVLQTRPADGAEQTDSEFYRAVAWRVRSGESYYSAFQSGYVANAAWGFPPQSVLSVRLPWLTRLWASLPGGIGMVPWLWLVYASVVMLLTYATVAATGHPSAAVVSVSLLATYAMFFSVNEYILYAEVWAGFAIVASAMLMIGRPSGISPWRMGFAAVLSVFAVMMREFALAAPVAGLFATLRVPQSLRRSGRIIWIGAVAVGVCVLALHFFQSSRIVEPVIGLSTWVSRLGIDDLYNAGWWGTFFVFPGRPVAVAAAAILFFGALMIPPGPARTYVHTVAGLLVVVFALVGNVAVASNGTRFNYWGASLTPLLYAAGPLGIASGFSRGRTSESPGEPAGDSLWMTGSRPAIMLAAVGLAAVAATLSPVHPAVIGGVSGLLVASVMKKREWSVLIAVALGSTLAAALDVAGLIERPDMALVMLWAAGIAFHCSAPTRDEAPA